MTMASWKHSSVGDGSTNTLAAYCGRVLALRERYVYALFLKLLGPLCGASACLGVQPEELVSWFSRLGARMENGGPRP